MINAVLYLVRNLRAIVCLPENITFLSTRNRATMPSLGKIEEFNSATTGIIATWSDWNNISWQTAFPPTLQSLTNEEQS